MEVLTHPNDELCHRHHFNGLVVTPVPFYMFYYLEQYLTCLDVRHVFAGCEPIRMMLEGLNAVLIGAVAVLLAFFALVERCIHPSHAVEKRWTTSKNWSICGQECLMGRPVSQIIQTLINRWCPRGLMTFALLTSMSIVRVTAILKQNVHAS